MKLKLTEPNIPIFDINGRMTKGHPYSRPIEFAVMDLFWADGVFHGKNDSGGQIISNPGFPITLFGYRNADHGYAPVRLEIADRQSGYKLCRIARQGLFWDTIRAFDQSVRDPSIFKNNTGHWRRIWECAHLRPSVAQRTIMQLAGYSKFYRGEQLVPRDLPTREGEKWLAVEVECFFPNGVERTDLLKAFHNNKIWGICTKGDGSIRPDPSDGLPVELILCRPRNNYDVPLRRFCDLIKSLGGKANLSCGLHVHYDFRGVSEAQVVRAAKRLESHMQFVVLLLHYSRRDESEQGRRYCHSGLSWADRYCRVNLNAYQKFHTLEVRAHHGTVEYQDIINWINLCGNLMETPLAKYRGKNLDYWLEHLPVSDREREYWREQAVNFSGNKALTAHVMSNRCTSSPMDEDDGREERERMERPGECRTPPPVLRPPVYSYVGVDAPHRRIVRGPFEMVQAQMVQSQMAQPINYEPVRPSASFMYPQHWEIPEPQGIRFGVTSSGQISPEGESPHPIMPTNQ